MSNKMKFIIIQCVKAYHPELEQLFGSLHIDAYSEMDVEGFMKNADGNSDFSNCSRQTKILTTTWYLFTFLAEDNAAYYLSDPEFNDGIAGMARSTPYIIGVEMCYEIKTSETDKRKYRKSCWQIGDPDERFLPCWSHIADPDLVRGLNLLSRPLPILSLGMYAER